MLQWVFQLHSISQLLKCQLLGTVVLFNIERLSAQAFSNSKLDLKNYLGRFNIPHQCKSLFQEAPSSCRAEGLTQVVAKVPHPAQLSSWHGPAAHMSPAVSPTLLWLWKGNTAGTRETCTTPTDVSLAIKHPARSTQPLTDLWARVCYLLFWPQHPQASGSPQNADKALQECPPPEIRSTQITKSAFL